MKKAVPKFSRSRFASRSFVHAEWERQIDNYDRTARRRNKRHREHVVRIGQLAVSLISSDHKLPLSRLNDLDPLAVR